MSESPEISKSQNQEIDLLDLLRRMSKTIINWSNALGRVFLISLFFLLKRWLPLTLSLILGIGASYLLKRTSNPVYESELVIRPNAISTGEVYVKIRKIQKYVQEGNQQGITNMLLLNPDEAKSLIGIAALWFIDKGRDGIPDYVDYENSFNPMKDTTSVRMIDRSVVYVRIMNPQYLPSLRDGIVKYLNSDTLYQARNRVRLKHGEEMFTRLGYDITQLDSLQKILYFQETKLRQPKEGGQMIFLQDQKTQLIYTDVQSLFARKQSIEAELVLYNNIVTVISDFSVPINRMNNTFYFAKKIIPTFLIITLFFLILFANRVKIKESFYKY